MIITDVAKKRLLKLLPKHASGFRYEGYIGTCRGSTPIIKPMSGPSPNEEIFVVDDITFFILQEDLARLDTCTLDYDPSFFGKGLSMKWHAEGCACKH